MFHANPWGHVRLHPETAAFEEHENPYSTPDSLYQLCDTAHLYETFKDDFDVQARLAQLGAADVNLGVLGATADALGMTADFSSQQAHCQHCTQPNANVRTTVEHVYRRQGTGICRSGWQRVDGSAELFRE